MSRSTIIRKLESLQNKGFLSKQQRCLGDGNKTSNLYKLNCVTSRFDNVPSTFQPSTCQPSTVNSPLVSERHYPSSTETLPLVSERHYPSSTETPKPIIEPTKNNQPVNQSPYSPPSGDDNDFDDVNCYDGEDINRSQDSQPLEPTVDAYMAALDGLPPPKPTKRKTAQAEAFDEFWQAYPKKQGKKAAEKAFQKAIKQTTLEQMLQAIAEQRQSQQWQDKQYIPNPATWLNQGRWDDELPAQRMREQQRTTTRNNNRPIDMFEDPEASLAETREYSRQTEILKRAIAALPRGKHSNNGDQ